MHREVVEFGPLLVLQLACTLAVVGLGLHGLGRLLRARGRLLADLAGGVLAGLLAIAPFVGSDRLLFPGLDPAVLPGATFDQGPGEYAVLSDVALQLIPWESEVRRLFRAGAPPFWSDRIAAGEPLWTNPQAQVLSPVALLARIFPLEHHLLAALAIKVTIAFMGASLLASSLGVRRSLSLVAAASVAFGGSLASWALFPITGVVAWVPWFLLACLKVGRRVGRRPLLAAGIISAFVASSGHPEAALFAATIGGTLGWYTRRRSLGIRFVARRLAAMGALGFLLSAPILMPFLSVVRASQRYVEASGDNLISPWTPQAGPLALAFDPGSWRFLLTPLGATVFGVPYSGSFSGPYSWPESTAGYAGIVCLAGWLMAGVGRSRVGRALALGAVTTLLLAAGLRPLVVLLDALPLLRPLALNRLLPLTAILITMAGALGLERALRDRSRAGVVRLVGGLAIVSLWLAPSRSALLSWTVALACLGLARRQLGSSVLLLVVSLELLPWFWRFLPASPRETFYPETAILGELRESLGQHEPRRAVAGGYDAYPNLLSMYQIADPRPHNPMTNEAYRAYLAAAFDFTTTRERYFSPFDPANRAALARLSVRHVLAPASDTAPERRLIVDLPEALPLFFAPVSVDCIAVEELAGWIRSATEPRGIALVGTPDCETIDPLPASSIERITARPNGYELTLKREARGLLASSLVAVPGWSAERDGTRQRVISSPGVFLAIELADSGSELAIRYRPPRFLCGVLLAGCGIGCCGLLLLGRRP